MKCKHEEYDTEILGQIYCKNWDNGCQVSGQILPRGIRIWDDGTCSVESGVYFWKDHGRVNCLIVEGFSWRWGHGKMRRKELFRKTKKLNIGELCGECELKNKEIYNDYLQRAC